ncbi:MAG: nucleotide exchange factor GrpE [Phycisphaerae bacterium]
MPSRKIASSRPKGSESGRRTARADTKVSAASSAARAKRDAAAPISHAPGTPADVLARAEADIAAAVDSLNKQMSTAMATITELAVAQRGRGEAVIRTAPLDRATATFQRLIAEVVDEKLAEMLPPLISLRNEMDQRANGRGASDGTEEDFCRRGLAALDQVLAGAEVRRYDARVGEAFDPVIHLAVGETNRADLANGAVAESLQPGFRSSRGKVIVPARVKVNRR